MTGDCYMNRPCELEKQPKALPIFEMIAAGGDGGHLPEDIFNGLWSFWNFAHALDDLIDECGWSLAVKESVLRTTFNFTGNLLICPADSSAAQPMRQMFEELLDKSGWGETRKRLALAALKDFTGNLLANPFYTEHADEHKAMFDMIIARTLDADEIEQTQPRLVPLLPAIRCGDVDFVVHCAKLAGGWELMRKTGRLRDYDV